MAEILDVTESDFESNVIQAEEPVIVDFWATWCAPCRQLAPTLKELADDYDGKIRVAKVDTDASPSLAAKYNVRALPTLIFMKGGEVAGQLVGNQPKAALSEKIDELLASR